MGLPQAVRDAFCDALRRFAFMKRGTPREGFQTAHSNVPTQILLLD